MAGALLPLSGATSPVPAPASSHEEAVAAGISIPISSSPARKRMPAATLALSISSFLGQLRRAAGRLV